MRGAFGQTDLEFLDDLAEFAGCEETRSERT
jgi:hypothetical protein